MKFTSKQEKRAFRIGCAVGRKQAKRNIENNRQAPAKRQKPIGVIPYDLGLAKCRYADELKRQDLQQGKTLRPESYYHDKAWKALGMDELLKERGFK